MKPRATRGSNTTGQRQVGTFLGAKPLDRALAGASADFRGIAQIGGVDRARKIIVALHAGAVPAMTLALTPWLDPAYAPAKPLEAASAIRERPQPASAPSELVTPGTASAASSAARARSIRISAAGSSGSSHVERGPVAGDLVGIGDAAIGIFGHRPRHRQRPLDEFRERLRRPIGRRHHGLLAADKHPQAEIMPLRSLELFGLAETPSVRQRGSLEQ